MIARDIVITAAHCGDRTGDRLYIGALEYDNGFIRPPTRQFRRCVEWVAHPDFFNAVPWPSDFALCKLSSPVEIDESDIPKLNQDASIPVDDEILTMIGFGITERNTVSDYLLEVDAPAMSLAECKRNFVSSIDSRHVCIGYSFGDGDFINGAFPSADRGDSGGPALKREVIDGNNVYTLIGVTSFGSKDFAGFEGRPSVYAAISSAIGWIYDTACDLLDSDDSNFCNSRYECAGPELQITVKTDSKPEQNSWELSVKDGDDFERVVFMSRYTKSNFEYEHKLCLELGKEYKWVLTDKILYSDCYYPESSDSEDSADCPSDFVQIGACGIRPGDAYCLREDVAENCPTIYTDTNICECGSIDSCGKMCDGPNNCGFYQLTFDGDTIPDVVGSVDENSFVFQRMQSDRSLYHQTVLSD